MTLESTSCQKPLRVIVDSAQTLDMGQAAFRDLGMAVEAILRLIRSLNAILVIIRILLHILKHRIQVADPIQNLQQTRNVDQEQSLQSLELSLSQGMSQSRSQLTPSIRLQRTLQMDLSQGSNKSRAQLTIEKDTAWAKTSFKMRLL